jgi:putative SOS response-associated peptidase YedK
MCGRYATARDPADLIDEFGVDRVVLEERHDEGVAPEDGSSQEGLPPNYNVAPTDEVYAVLERLDKERPSAPPQRQLRVVRWGLVPSWAKDRKIASKLINARVETLTQKPAFRKAFAVRRCLLPADGYYEWYTDDASDAATDGPGGKRPKQPYFIRGRGGGVLPMAGLYEFWRDPNTEPDVDPWLWSATVITTEATDDVGRIHDRMPMLIEPHNWARWLDPREADTAALSQLLVPAAAGRLEAYPVSTQVNDVRNDGPQLIEPISVGRDAVKARSDG